VISVIGEALVDIIVDPRGEVTSVVGGAPLNTARTCARLGLPTDFLGGVSTDAFGNRIMALLAQDGVRLGLGHQVPEPTTLAIAQIDESGAATYRFLMEGTSAAAVTPQAALASIDSSCRVIHAGTLGLVLQPLADASVAVVQAAGDDTIVMIDPNCRPSVMTGSTVFASAYEKVLARADVVKISGDDAEFLAPGTPTIDYARALHERTGAVVLLTDGSHAVHVLVAGGEAVLDVPRVPVVDTVGAGDSFSGGFLVRWLNEGRGRGDLANLDAVVDAARYGIAVAGVTCQRPGADPPRPDEVPGEWSVRA
jgi:fructokinase